MCDGKKLLTLISLILMIGGPASAGSPQDVSEKDSLTIGEISTTLVSADENDSPAEPELGPYRGRSNRKQLATAAIVNAGLTAWGVINSNQANGYLNSNFANAMPNWVDWNTIAGWKGPKKFKYNISAKSIVGITVVDVEYLITFFYGGTSGDSGNPNDCLIAAGCVGGAATCPSISNKCQAASKTKGSYISNLRIKPLKVYIQWPIKFDLDAIISNPMNKGTVADPIAYLQADLSWALTTPFSKFRGVRTYEVNGKGGFRDLSNTNEEQTSKAGEEQPGPERPADSKKTD
jgi:hypothetical protein